MKKIAIDARFINPETMGVGRYSFELISHLNKLNHPELKFDVFLPKNMFPLLSFLSSSFRLVEANEPWYSFVEQYSLRKKLYAAKPDLVHFLQFNHPLFLKIPYIVTVHDIIPLFYREKHVSKVKALLYKFEAREAIRNAQKVIAVSKRTKSDLIKYFAADPAKISVIYHGVDAGNQRGRIHSSQQEIKGVNLKRPFFLYVGQQRIHKNVDGLIEGFAEFKRSYPEAKDFQLVLAGKKNNLAVWLSKAISESGFSKAVILTDFVSNDELSALYAHSQGFIFPSFMEGFGLPPLEAMAHGAPVASSNASCMPEVLGKAAIYFDPNSPKEIAKAMHSLAVDKELRERLKALGKSQAANYKWQVASEETLDLYKKLLKI